MSDSLKDKITGTGLRMADFFINLSSEYSAILNFILYVAAFVGVMIVSSSIFELIRMGQDKHAQQSRTSAFSIITKNLGAVFLMSFAWSVKMFTATLWAEHDPLNLAKYDASASSGDYSQQTIIAVTGFFILTGCVFMFKSYLALAKLGSMPDEERGVQWGRILSYMGAGSILVCINVIVALFKSY